MKKYLILGLNLSFYISSLLFFNQIEIVTSAILVIYIYALKNKYYSLFFIVLMPFLTPLYMALLGVIIVLPIIFYKYINKNRLYHLALYSVSNLILLSTCLIGGYYELKNLFSLLFSIIFYGITISLFRYYVSKNKKCIALVSPNLLHLLLHLYYFLLITIYNPIPFLYDYLFLSLFIVEFLPYLFIFITTGILIYAAIYKNLALSIIYSSIYSIFPPLYLFELNYTKIESYYFIVYIILLLLTRITYKVEARDVTIESFINTMNGYNHLLDDEYSRIKTIKELKGKRLIEIQKKYCNQCTLNTNCKKTISDRIPFLCNAITFNDFNRYNCPYYKYFYLDSNITYNTIELPITTFRLFLSELETEYHQTMLRKKEFDKLKSALKSFGYSIIEIKQIYQSNSPFYQISLENKLIDKALFLKLAHKYFHETLDVKIVNTDTIQYVYLYKIPKCRIAYSHQILAKESNCISGDNYYIKREYNDSYIFALSDGMGNGHTAYIESADTLSKFKSLIDYHLSIPTTLQLLSQIEEMKCEFDSYATLDVLYLNTSTMHLTLYKLGSSNSYIIHNNEVTVYENKALPYQKIDSNSIYDIEIFHNDIIILGSDGLTDYISIGVLKNNINYNQTPEEIRNSILNNLQKKDDKSLADDVSIIVIKIL